MIFGITSTNFIIDSYEKNGFVILDLMENIDYNQLMLKINEWNEGEIIITSSTIKILSNNFNRIENDFGSYIRVKYEPKLPNYEIVSKMIDFKPSNYDGPLSNFDEYLIAIEELYVSKILDNIEKNFNFTLHSNNKLTLVIEYLLVNYKDNKLTFGNKSVLKLCKDVAMVMGRELPKTENINYILNFWALLKDSNLKFNEIIDYDKEKFEIYFEIKNEEPNFLRMFSLIANIIGV